MKLVCIRLGRLGVEPILAGRLAGKRMFVDALQEMPLMSEAAIVLLDFAGIELATSSFLSELLIPLRDHLRLRRPPGYVVAANANGKVREEMDELLSRIGDALLVCDSADTKISNLALVGNLDPKLSETLELVRRKGETSAVELHSEFADFTPLVQRPGTTASRHWPTKVSLLKFLRNAQRNIGQFWRLRNGC